MKPFIWTSASRTHKRRIEGRAQIWNYNAWKKCAEAKSELLLQTDFHQDKWNQAWTKSFTKVYKSLIRGKDVSDFNKPNVFRFPKKCWNKVWATFANIIASRQVKSSINEILHQVQKILVRGNHKPNCNKLSGFRFSGMCWNKVWATLVNRIAYR